MALLHLPHHHSPPPCSSSSRCCICIGGTTAATTRPSSSFFPKQGKRNSSIPVGGGQVACPLPAAYRRRSHCHRLLRCSSSAITPARPSEVGAVELPLFPLPLVLFPGAVLPLQIFEFRYRILTHTLLQTDLRLGVVFSDSGSVAGVGCVGEVVKHERLVDDRFFLVCKGQERFRVSRVVRTKPYLVAEVVWLEDRPSSEGEEGPEALAVEVERYMRDVIRISNRLKGKEEKAAETEAEAVDLRRNLFPTPFSFFVGSTFEGAPREQQALLELEDTAARLKRERETLRSTLNYLTAAAAVKDAFPSSSSSSSPS